MGGSFCTRSGMIKEVRNLEEVCRHCTRCDDTGWEFLHSLGNDKGGEKFSKKFVATVPGVTIPTYRTVV